MAIIALLVLALLVLAERALSYYCTVLGLIYYLGSRHDDLVSADKVKKLRDEALARLLAEHKGKR